MRRRPRYPLASTRPPSPAPVEVLKTDQRVWDLAVALADGNVHRLERIDEETVVVRNRPRS